MIHSNISINSSSEFDLSCLADTTTTSEIERLTQPQQDTFTYTSYTSFGSRKIFRQENNYNANDDNDVAATDDEDDDDEEYDEGSSRLSPISIFSNNNEFPTPFQNITLNLKNVFQPVGIRQSTFGPINLKLNVYSIFHVDQPAPIKVGRIGQISLAPALNCFNSLLTFVGLGGIHHVGVEICGFGKSFRDIHFFQGFVPLFASKIIIANKLSIISPLLFSHNIQNIHLAFVI